MSEDRDPIDDVYEEDAQDAEPQDEDDQDTGTEDDIPDEDADEGEDAESESVEAQRSESQRQSRRSASDEIRELRARAQKAERERDEERRRVDDAQRSRNAEDFRRQEQERLEQMSPEERIEYRVNQRLAGVEFRAADTSDRVLFEGMMRDQPAVSAIKDEVEAIYQERVKQGNWVDRATIATFLIGQKALSRQPRAKAAGKRAEQAGRERNQVRPTSGRSDAASGGRTRMTEQEARRKRLENVTF
jgi:hypothetical protein